MYWVYRLLQKILPSVSKRDEKIYNKLRKRLRQSRSNVTSISRSNSTISSSTVGATNDKKTPEVEENVKSEK